ncbi:MAG: hypothetical protein PUF12_05855 [Thermoflexaceae bacterium]|nr:hypothetical protein [Thermoflexaceae bacterium]
MSKVLLELAKYAKKDFEHDIILAKVNGKLTELTKEVPDDAVVEFVTTDTVIGNLTYKRSVCMLMLSALYDVVPANKIKKICVQYSLSKGYYCDIEGDIEVTEEFLLEVKLKMLELISLDLPIKKRSMNTEQAMELFRKHGMEDKVKLFKYRRVSRVNIYELNGFEDYNYGYMAPSTGMLDTFDLYQYDEGFVLQLPTKEEPDMVPEFKPQHKLFNVLKESTRWGNMLNVDTVGALNDAIASGNISELILVQEALQEKKIADIAEEIASKPDKKFIMIAGPSSSGKTTFSHRLAVQLKAHGLKPHTIEVDNYFVEREQTPKDENGDYNFECLEAIDIDLFNQQMMDLLHGKTVEVPTFNFKTGKKEYKGNTLTLNQDEILVIEGIHCLNDKLSSSIPAENKFKIYISALTQLNIDEHNRIPTTDGRLLRRMVRDARTRGASAKRTLQMWDSVRRGEEENIFPYQEEADVMFNSALIYELAVLKQNAEPLLFGIGKDEPEYYEAKRLLKFLDYFLGISTEDIPKNSIIREFIGGSIFRV